VSKLGIKAKLYRNTSSYLAPVWVEVKAISDLSSNFSWDIAPADSRESRIKVTAKTLADAKITGKIKVSNTDAGYAAFWEAAHSDTSLDLLVLNGAKDENGSRGYRGYYQVNNPNEDQGLGNVLYMDFELSPADADYPLKKAVVSAGAPAYTDIAA